MTRITGKQEIQEGEHVPLMDRVLLNSGEYLTQAAAESVTLEVIGPGADGVVYDEDLDIEDVIYDSLQVDGYWTADGTGYNLRCTLDSGAVPMVGGRLYDVIVTVHTADFGPKRSWWKIRVQDVPSVYTW